MRKFVWFDCAAWLLQSCFGGSIFEKIGGAGFFKARQFFPIEYNPSIHQHQIGLEIDDATTDTPPAVTPALPTRGDIVPTRRAGLGFVGRGNIRFIVDAGIMAPTAESDVKEYETVVRQNAAHVHFERQKEMI